MAENKKSFILYADLISVIKKLVEKDRENKTNYAGELFLHILEYVNDNNPVPVDFIVEMSFEPIKLQLKRDLVKWIEFREKQSENGKKGGRPTKATDKIENPKNPSLNSETQKSLNVTATVNDTVTATVNVKKEKLIISPEVKKLRGDCKQSFIDFYKLQKGEDFYWTAKDATNMNNLISKIVFKIKEKTGKETCTNDETLLAFNLIIKNIQDKWILDNYSLPNINSKFNEIFSQIKNSNNGTPAKDNLGRPVSKYHN